MQSTSRDTTDLLRAAGGVLLVAGSATLFARKAGHETWGNFPLLIIVLIPTLVLYGLAVVGASRGPDARAEPWRSVLLVASILLAPVVLLQLLQTLGVEKLTGLEIASVFVATAAIAAYGAWRGRVRYAVLLAGLASLVAWVVVWGNSLHQPSANTFRVLFVAGAALLLLAAVALGRRGAIGANEMATAAGVAAVLAGVLGVYIGTAVGAQSLIFSIGPHGLFGSPRHISGQQSFGWDLYLIVVSAALIGIGARLHSRGIGYVGGFGLVAFIYSVSLQVTRVEAGKDPTASLAGWPLALLILGVIGLAAPLFASRNT